jgi:hypothetical protein
MIVVNMITRRTRSVVVVQNAAAVLRMEKGQSLLVRSRFSFLFLFLVAVVVCFLVVDGCCRPCRPFIIVDRRRRLFFY